MSLNLPKAGYVPGEYLEFVVSVKNESNKKLKRINLKLNRVGNEFWS